MNSCFPARHQMCWHQRGKAFEPETGGFSFSVAEHPRLNALVRMADTVNCSTRVFDADAFNWRFHQFPYELQCFFLLRGVLVPPSSTSSEICAWWMGDHQVPAVVQHAEHVTLNVLPRTLRRKHITTPCVVSPGRKGVPHDARKLTGNQYPHVSRTTMPLSASRWRFNLLIGVSKPLQSSKMVLESSST